MTDSRVPVLWITGPAGVGKSTVSWQIFTELAEAGTPVAFADADQLCMCYPSPPGDPGRERIKARNVGALVPRYRAAGAQCVIVNGCVDPQAGLRSELMPHAAATVCRLRADPGEITERLTRRDGPGQGGPDGPIAAALSEAAALDASSFADFCVDTSGVAAAYVAGLVRQRCSDWPGFSQSPRRARQAPGSGVGGGSDTQNRHAVAVADGAVAGADPAVAGAEPAVAGADRAVAGADGAAGAEGSPDGAVAGVDGAIVGVGGVVADVRGVGAGADGAAGAEGSADGAAGGADGEILLICGPTGVGKSTIGFQVYVQRVRQGHKAGYVDLDQIGFVRPGPAADPGGHRLKAANLAAMWRTYHAEGARHLVATGPVESDAALRAYIEALPAANVTVCRLHAGPAELTRRIMSRADGGSWPQPGDPLRGQPAGYLRQVADRAIREANALEQTGPAGIRVDTDGRSAGEAADLIAAITG